MPSLAQVTAYLQAHQLERHLSELVALCVDESVPQPLARIAAELAARASDRSVEFDYVALVADLKQLLHAQPSLAPLCMRLSWHDAGMYSIVMGDGKPNAALRFTESGEGAFEENKSLADVVRVLAPLKAKYPAISHADLWALAANVALEFMGGPKVTTRFGRVDAASAAESVASAKGRLPEAERNAEHLREVFRSKGFSDREIVAFTGRHTVGEFDEGLGFSGRWTSSPLLFDNSFYIELLRKQWRPQTLQHSQRIQMVDAEGSAAMMLIDYALLDDPSFRPIVERYATDLPRFLADFASVWVKMQELGCSGLRLHPQSLEYASSCCIPTEWAELPLKRRSEYNHDTTRYTFELPGEQALQLPVCASLLVQAPSSSNFEWSGQIEERPYTPISSTDFVGSFELLVKRYEGGTVSQYLHSLHLGSMVKFRHTAHELHVQFPFEGKATFSLICAGTGITPMFQILVKLMTNPGDEREVVLLYGSKSVQDILLKDELADLVRKYPSRLRVVHVVGNRPTEASPKGWVSTPTYMAESGWIDEEKIAKYAYPPSADTLVCVCGPSPVYDSLCGPREQPSLREGSILHLLGYSLDMVAKI
ncbi:hypothetical protein AB1Y20_010718 [Prymnesium parvum]|uniref:Cytochrome-b5 reductase n=1 Tax=Prymnesium parvum TaxID=97485 RepID=A0AB34ISA9_PRYPA